MWRFAGCGRGKLGYSVARHPRPAAPLGWSTGGGSRSRCPRRTQGPPPQSGGSCTGAGGHAPVGRGWAEGRPLNARRRRRGQAPLLALRRAHPSGSALPIIAPRQAHTSGFTQLQRPPAIVGKLLRASKGLAAAIRRVTRRCSGLGSSGSSGEGASAKGRARPVGARRSCAAAPTCQGSSRHRLIGHLHLYLGSLIAPPGPEERTALTGRV